MSRLLLGSSVGRQSLPAAGQWASAPMHPKRLALAALGDASWALQFQTFRPQAGCEDSDRESVGATLASSCEALRCQLASFQFAVIWDDANKLGLSFPNC